MASSFSCLLTGIGIGAGWMYFFDPDVGRRRRKLCLDQSQRAVCDLNRAADTTWRDLRNRSYGLFAQMRSRIDEHDNSDETVVARVRSKLGRFTSHPSAIQVTAHEGHVTLSGPILASEAQQVIRAVRQVIGVCSVANHLDIHETAENVSALQGGRRAPRGETMELLQDNWAPATRFVAISAGAGLMTWCLSSRSPLSMLAGTLGFGLTCRALSNPGTGQRQGSRAGNQQVARQQAPLQRATPSTAV